MKYIHFLVYWFTYFMSSSKYFTMFYLQLLSVTNVQIWLANGNNYFKGLLWWKGMLSHKMSEVIFSSSVLYSKSNLLLSGCHSKHVNSLPWAQRAATHISGNCQTSRCYFHELNFSRSLGSTMLEFNRDKF